MFLPVHIGFNYYFDQYIVNSYSFRVVNFIQCSCSHVLYADGLDFKCSLFCFSKILGYPYDVITYSRSVVPMSNYILWISKSERSNLYYEATYLFSSNGIEDLYIFSNYYGCIQFLYVLNFMMYSVYSVCEVFKGFGQSSNGFYRQNNVMMIELLTTFFEYTTFFYYYYVYFFYVYRIFSVYKLDFCSPYIYLFDFSFYLLLPIFSFIQLYVFSIDVIHTLSFYSWCIKIDVIPGRINLTTTLRLVFNGEYRGKCFELCGQGHFSMMMIAMVL